MKRHVGLFELVVTVFALVSMLVIILRFSTDLQAQNIFVAGRLTATTTASSLYAAGPRGSSVLFCNRHTTSVFLGGSAALTTANGFELLAGDCTTMRPYPRAAVWFIVAAATARIDYAEGQYREP